MEAGPRCYNRFAIWERYCLGLLLVEDLARAALAAAYRWLWRGSRHTKHSSLELGVSSQFFLAKV